MLIYSHLSSTSQATILDWGHWLATAMWFVLMVYKFWQNRKFSGIVPQAPHGRSFQDGL
jgi:hypothetical protein